MTPEEAQAWLRGDRCMVNGVDMHPVETWPERVATADAAMLQCAYWVARAHQEKLVAHTGPKGEDMREVSYKTWNRRTWEPDGVGVFLGWGQESDTDGCAYPVAILELTDGSVVTRPTQAIRFIGKETTP